MIFRNKQNCGDRKQISSGQRLGWGCWLTTKSRGGVWGVMDLFVSWFQWWLHAKDVQNHTLDKVELYVKCILIFKNILKGNSLAVQWLGLGTFTMEDLGSIPGSGRSPGGGHGNPLQYSCLENPMDRGAWRATVHGAKRSQIQLSSRAHRHTPQQTKILWAMPWPKPQQFFLKDTWHHVQVVVIFFISQTTHM